MAQPNFIPKPFAVNGDKNTIPESTTAGAASWQLGFPPITALPLGAGGVAPDRKDFNAVLYALSAHAVFMQTGGVWTYDAQQSYAPPALVYDDSDDNLYFCVGANGPNGTVMAPHSDTTGQYWQKMPWGDMTWLFEPIPTRTGDTTFTVSGDARDKFPMGKLLRFNSSDAYLCRVFGSPVYGSGLTTVTVWFDNANNVIPSPITRLERSRLIPEATARGVALVTTTQYTEDQIMKLLQSHCYSSVTIKGA